MADPVAASNYTVQQAVFAITQCVHDPDYVENMIKAAQDGKSQVVVDDLLRQSNEAVASVAAYNQAPHAQLPPLTLLTYNFLVEDTLREIKQRLPELMKSMSEQASLGEGKFTRWFSVVSSQLSDQVNDVMNIKNQVLDDPRSASRLAAMESAANGQVALGEVCLGQDENGQRFSELARKREASLSSLLGVGASETTRLQQRGKLDEAIKSTMDTLSLSAPSPSIARPGYSR